MQKAAAAAPPVTYYTCSGAPDYICSEDPNGEYDTLEACLAACIAPPVTKYHCTGAPNYECVEAEDGEYETLEECQTACVAPPQNTCNSCDPAIPDTLYVLLGDAGHPLVGDFEPYNYTHGKITLQWNNACIWQYGEGVNIVYLQWIGGPNYWRVMAMAKANCWKYWNSQGGAEYACVPTGLSYSETDCEDVGCTDTNSCPNSAGAPCVVSLT